MPVGVRDRGLHGAHDVVETRCRVAIDRRARHRVDRSRDRRSRSTPATWRATSMFTGPGDCSIRISSREVEAARGIGNPGPIWGTSLTAPVYGPWFEGTVAVTGVSGFLGQRLLPLLDAIPDVDAHRRTRRARSGAARPQARVPPRRHPRHRSRAVPARRGHGRAPRRDRRPDARRSPVDPRQRRRHAARARGREPRRRAQGRAAVEHGGLRRVGEQSGADHRRRAAAPESRLSPRDPRRRVRTPARASGRTARTVASRPACASLRSSARGRARCSPQAATGHPPVILRAPRRRPCRSCTSTTSAARARLAVEQSISTGVYNVAADGWLASEDADALLPRRHLPGIPYEAAERVLQVHVGQRARRRAARDRSRTSCIRGSSRTTASEDAGWKPRHSNDEAILLASPAPVEQQAAVDRGRGRVRHGRAAARRGG